MTPFTKNPEIALQLGVKEDVLVWKGSDLDILWTNGWNLFSLRINFRQDNEKLNITMCVWRWFALPPCKWTDKRKFSHIVCINIAVNSPKEKILLFLCTQYGRHDVTCKLSIPVRIFCFVFRKISVGQIYVKQLLAWWQPQRYLSVICKTTYFHLLIWKSSSRDWKGFIFCKSLLWICFLPHEHRDRFSFRSEIMSIFHVNKRLDYFSLEQSLPLICMIF